MGKTFNVKGIFYAAEIRKQQLKNVPLLFAGKFLSVKKSLIYFDTVTEAKKMCRHSDRELEEAKAPKSPETPRTA